jgi:hypothetical protein
MSVSFETKVWEKDYEIILKSGRIQNMIARCHYPFEQKKLFINNVNDLAKVQRLADKLISKSVIDQYVVVDDFAKEALDFFELSKESLGRGYYYSIAELVSIYLCTTKYLLHFSGDSIPMRNSNSQWLYILIKKLESNPKISVANLLWNQKTQEAIQESIEHDSQFCIGYGFSDQMYLIRTDEFRGPIFNEHNEKSNHYPSYGGELFEKRIHSYMLNHERLRATYLESSYKHRNFSKKPWVRQLNQLFDWY